MESAKTVTSEPNMARQGSVVASMTLLSRISGLLRDVVLSYLFGASQLADMFFVAFRIPNFFRRLFAEGAFNQAFVPVLMQYKTMGHAQLLVLSHPLRSVCYSLAAFGVGGVVAPALAACLRRLFGSTAFINKPPIWFVLPFLIWVLFLLRRMPCVTERSQSLCATRCDACDAQSLSDVGSICRNF